MRQTAIHFQFALDKRHAST